MRFLESEEKENKERDKKVSDSLKNALRICILTAMLVTALGISASALTEGDWEFQLLEDEVHITDYLGSGGDVVIPSTIRGATVTELGDLDMFYNKATSITFPGTIKKIEWLSYGWDALESMTFEEGVESITGCIIQHFKNLRSISLPSTLKNIGDHTFANSAITQISLPAGLEKIGFCAFNSSALESIDLSGLRSVDLGISAFANCENLQSIIFPNNLETIPQTLLEDCKNLRSVDIPASVKTINNLAFSGCSLTEVYFPVGIQHIGAGAFCNNPLTEVILPYGLTEEGSGDKYHYGVFGDCKALQAVYIPDTVQKMGTNIIRNCPNCIIYCGEGSYAAEFCKKNGISYSIDNSVNSSIHVMYNGKRISFAETGQNPVIENGRTLVPLRAIFETMGATVDWNDTTRTITATLGSDTINLTLGDNILYKNGEAIMTMDVAAKTLNGRTVVPARAVSEAFGAQVNWIGAAQIVVITK